MFGFNRTSPQLETLRNIRSDTSVPKPDPKKPKVRGEKVRSVIGESYEGVGGLSHSFGNITALILFIKKWITFVAARRLNNLVLLVGYFLK